MKSWKLLPKIKIRSVFLKKLANQRGQSIVEFVLLLFVITMVSYGFVAVMNRNLARYWDYSVSLIVNDRPVRDPRFNLSN